MMLFRNSLFEVDGTIYRLLEVCPGTNKAWIIETGNYLAWPMSAAYDELSTESPVEQKFEPTRHPSSATRRKRDFAWSRLQPLIAYAADLYDPRLRQRAIEEVAMRMDCSERTLHKDLRKYWQRGQTPEALLPNYSKCGCSTVNVTAGRGCTPKQDYTPFQITQIDCQYFKEVIESGYMKDSRISIPKAYLTVLELHYTYNDGNNALHIAPLGSRPTMRQFERYLRANYSLEARIRGREGNKNFERDHRARLETVLSDCRGVGDIYEIDATIADIYLVSSSDVNKIIGKPTVYFIVDRKSRLIVGFYFGLENACWSGAMEAILSISGDKERLCARYAIPYDPEDWPAHQVFPNQFLGDRGGEVIGESSNQVSESLFITVTNTAGLRPDLKSNIECNFKLVHEQIKDIAPAYDPPSNATRRRGKHYENDASFTLHAFCAMMINIVISANRKEMLNYDLSLEELSAGVRPSPIGLWNHNIQSRMGQLTKFPEEHVRLKLLPKGTATVSDHGIEFLNCVYSSPEAIASGWFVNARKKHFKVEVSYDSRLVDNIYIHDPNERSDPHRAELTNRSSKYEGHSFAEVKAYEAMRNAIRNESAQSRLQSALDLRRRVAPEVAKAKERLAYEGKGTTRSARKADTKSARTNELRIERQATALPQPQIAQHTGFNNAKSHSAVHSHEAQTAVLLSTEKLKPVSTAAVERDEPTRDQVLQRLRKSMLGGVTPAVPPT